MSRRIKCDAANWSLLCFKYPYQPAACHIPQLDCSVLMTTTVQWPTRCRARRSSKSASISSAGSPACSARRVRSAQQKGPPDYPATLRKAAQREERSLLAAALSASPLQEATPAAVARQRGGTEHTGWSSYNRPAPAWWFWGTADRNHEWYAPMATPTA